MNFNHLYQKEEEEYYSLFFEVPPFILPNPKYFLYLHDVFFQDLITLQCNDLQ